MQLYRPNPILEYLRTHKYNVMLLGICVVCFGLAGVFLTNWIMSPGVPDVKTASPKQIGEFIQSDNFLDMPTAQRRKFVDSVVNKHVQMSDEERKNAFSQFRQMRKGDKASRDRMKQFFMDWGLQRANEYAQLPPQEREQYVDNLLNMAIMLGGGRRPDMERQRQRQRREQNKDHRAGLGRAYKAMAEMNRKTTAEERARTLVLMKDVMTRARERFGR